MKTDYRLHCAAIGMALILAGCASWNSSRVEATYGDAVHANFEAQLYDPAAARNPERNPVDGTDGQRMEGVMEAHRNQAGSAENVSSPIVIDVAQ